LTGYLIIGLNKIDMNEIIKKVKSLGFLPGSYAVFGSGPMTIRGLKEAKDIDIAVKDEFFEELKGKHKEFKPGQINIGDVEIFAAWNSLIDNAEEVIDRADNIDGVKFIKLEDLIVWKKKLAREKDLSDIKVIEDYLIQK